MIPWPFYYEAEAPTIRTHNEQRVQFAPQEEAGAGRVIAGRKRLPLRCQVLCRRANRTLWAPPNHGDEILRWTNLESLDKFRVLRASSEPGQLNRAEKLFGRAGTSGSLINWLPSGA